ncbi:MAG: SGNH/GDSL hydrolase family protein [Kiritimatiellaeota bacterium]|nr:SGNH/GDSL hydrolase family protein [Kiritimatiellota bacterium]
MKQEMRWLAAGALCAALGWGGALAAPAKKAAKPVTTSEAEGLPRVLIIGDSISIGYTPFVKQQLKDKANIIHAPGNNESTARGLEHLDAWLGPKKWDVIHFNWGLHDLKWIDDKTKITEVGKGKQWVPVETYEKNLAELVVRLKKTGAKLIFCTTTPVPDGVMGRVPGEEVKYNAAALRVMQSAGVTVNDLYAFVKPQREKLGKPKDVHYTNAGSEALAGVVSKAIEAALAK